MRHVARSRAAFVAALVIVLAGCASTEITSKWKDPAAPAVPFQKIAVLALAQEDLLRRTTEDAFVRGIAKSGAGVQSYTFIPSEQMRDKEAVHKALMDQGFDAAVVYRLVGVTTQQTYVPGTTYASPYYGTFGGYYGYYGAVAYEPGYLREDKVVECEAVLYSLQSEKLVWSGRSTTFAPSSAQQVIDEVVEATVYEMKKVKLLP